MANQKQKSNVLFTKQGDLELMIDALKAIQRSDNEYEVEILTH